MAEKFSARRYAEAVFGLEDKEHIADRQADLEQVASLKQDATIVAYLENPKIYFKDKASLLHARLGDVDPMMLNLVFLLVIKGGLNMLTDIAAEYQRLIDNYRGIERAEVTTAVPLDDEARLNLSQRLSQIIGKKVVIETELVDPNLIGGIVVKVAGKLLDGSTRGKLAALKKEIG